MTHDRAYYVAKLNGLRQKSVGGIMEAGRLLAEAKTDLDAHGEWLPLLQETGWDEDRAQRHIKVAKNPVLSNTAHGRYLPLDVKTLATLARIPEVQLLATLDKHEITPAMTRKEAATLVATAKEKKRESGADPSPGPKAYYSVDAWNKLPKAERARLIAEGLESGNTTAMAKQTSSSIEWASYSWNPVTGCLHGCFYCYARDIANKQYRNIPKGSRFDPYFHPERLASPLNVTPKDGVGAPRNIFANSMSDLFGKWVPRDWILATIDVARRCPQWNFLTLTKFPQRAAEFEFPDNWWMGTSVDTQRRVATAEKAFAKIRCKTKWLSCEPLLEPLHFEHLDLFQWVVIGGASKNTGSNQEAWVPYYPWVARLSVAALDAGCRVYHKTNIFGSKNLTKDCRPPLVIRRLVQFPWADVEEETLPESYRGKK